jgi:hypothetical protein
MGPIETTGLLGATSTRSAAASAPSTAGVGRASSIPTRTTSSASGTACNRTQYSWKCTARRPDGSSSAGMTMWVSTRSSLIGSSRSRGSSASQRAARAWVTSVNG